MTMQIVERQFFALPTRPRMVVQGMDAQRSIVEIGKALSAMADAALVSDDAVKIVAAKSFAAFTPGGSVSVFERSGEDWRADGRLAVPAPLARMLNAISADAQVSRVEGMGVFVTVNSGSMGVLLQDTGISEKQWPALRILAIGFELALASAVQIRGKLAALEEIHGFQQIAERILSAGDLDAILFAISQETKRLLSADICGVFLRDQDHMVMRDCTGNQTRNMAKIRLGRGQGLAGRVFETGLHCVVDDYLTSDILTQENADLVRTERIRSAPRLVQRRAFRRLDWSNASLVARAREFPLGSTLASRAANAAATRFPERAALTPDANLRRPES